MPSGTQVPSRTTGWPTLVARERVVGADHGRRAAPGCDQGQVGGLGGAPRLPRVVLPHARADRGRDGAQQRQQVHGPVARGEQRGHAVQRTNGAGASVARASGSAAPRSASLGTTDRPVLGRTSVPRRRSTHGVRSSRPRTRTPRRARRRTPDAVAGHRSLRWTGRRSARSGPGRAVASVVEGTATGRQRARPDAGTSVSRSRRAAVECTRPPAVVAPLLARWRQRRSPSAQRRRRRGGRRAGHRLPAGPNQGHASTAPRPPSPRSAPTTAQPRTPCTTVRVGTVSPSSRVPLSGPAPTGSGRRRPGQAEGDGPAAAVRRAQPGRRLDPGSP